MVGDLDYLTHIFESIERLELIRDGGDYSRSDAEAGAAALAEKRVLSWAARSVAALAIFRLDLLK